MLICVVLISTCDVVVCPMLIFKYCNVYVLQLKKKKKKKEYVSTLLILFSFIITLTPVFNILLIFLLYLANVLFTLFISFLRFVFNGHNLYIYFLNSKVKNCFQCWPCIISPLWFMLFICCLLIHLFILLLSCIIFCILSSIVFEVAVVIMCLLSVWHQEKKPRENRRKRDGRKPRLGNTEWRWRISCRSGSGSCCQRK